MDILVIVGLILAVINPVIGGVLVGYIVWLREPVVGLQIIILSFTMMSLFVIAFMVWAGKKLKKMEQRLKSLE
jgi:hypothetical protein